MSDRYVRVVSLWIQDGQEAAFDAYERDAARLMAKFGGKIDRAFRTLGQGPDTPFEVHFVSFPDRAAADSFNADPETQALRSRRADIIARTDILEGSEVGPY